MKGSVFNEKNWINFFLFCLSFLIGCETKTTVNNSTSKITKTNNTQSETIESTFLALEIETPELDVFRYYLYTPKNPIDNMPLIVYLHGGSGKGDDLTLITNVEGFPKYLRDGQLGEVEAYVIIPQVPSTNRGWPEIRTSLDFLIDSTVTEYNLDKDRISLTGHSMGGTGTWNVALKEPNRFYKIAPLSGSIKTIDENLDKLENLQIWTMVGSADTIVDPDATITFMEEMKKLNPNAKITIFEEATHFDVPALAYLDKELGLIDWLIN